MKRIPILLLCAAVATGCASTPPADSDVRDDRGRTRLPEWTDDAMRIASTGGTFIVAYRTVPAPIPLNDLFSIDAAVLDPDGRPVTDLDLRIDARMPAHRHGMVRVPRIVANDDGTYTASGMLFHMPGHWQIHFDVERADGVIERAQTDVELD